MKISKRSRTVQIVMSPPIQREVDDGRLAREDLDKQLQSDFDQYQKIKKYPGPKRAQVIHHIVDNYLENFNLPENKVMNDSIKCRKGCNFCCYQNVEVTWDEAALLVQDHYDKIDWQHLNDQMPGHQQIEYVQRACVFLKDGECSVYKDRPISCRKYLVANDPQECNSEKYPNGKTEVVYMRAAELLATSMMTIQNSGPMAKMLLAVKAVMKK